MNDRLIDFYRGGRDSRYRTLNGMLKWNDSSWGIVHDHMHWLFPTRMAARYDQNVYLDDETVAIWATDERVTANYRRSFQRFLQFCGLVWTGTGVEALPSESRQLQCVVNIPNVHWIYISRVLMSLSELGFNAEATLFYEFLSANAANWDDRAVLSIWAKSAGVIDDPTDETAE